LRDFSKQENAEERTELARTIRSERRERDSNREEEAKLIAELETLNAQLEEYNSASFLEKIRDTLKVRALREKLGVKNARKEELDSLPTTTDQNTHAKDRIDELYGRERERWASAKYSKEDIAALFTEEHLASLSVEDYALLMKRFPSEMVTHVTRQGVRDHTGMIYHSAGAGEFHHGFEKLVEDGRLRSPLAVSLAEAQKEDDILKLLSRPTLDGGRFTPQTREEALEELDHQLHKYADRSAVHVAAEAVADFYYGSERGNELFVAFPSAFVASQYHFGYRSLTGGTEEMHNDVYVWDKEEKGMNLNAGLVFIPKNARVDPNTGSRYELGPDKKPIEHESVPIIRSWVTSPDFPAIAEQIREATKQTNKYSMPPIEEWDELAQSSYKGDSQRIAKALSPIKHTLEAMGITHPKILASLISYEAADGLTDALRREEGEAGEAGYHLQKAINRMLESSGVRYAEAKDTISSQEYWEQKFAEHPDRRPSKVVYYEGADPGGALRAWQKKNGLTKKAQDEDIGFTERRVGLRSEPALTGMARFESLIRKAIDDRFPESAT